MKWLILFAMVLAVRPVFAQSSGNDDATKMIKVSADCADENLEPLKENNQACVRREVRKLARRACNTNRRVLYQAPKISVNCTAQGALYICRGQATAYCGLDPTESIAPTVSLQHKDDL